MRRNIWHKIGVLFPALTWLFIQLAMSGALSGSPANAMQVQICSSFGAQQIWIDPETGEPVEPAIGGDCDWCQTFGTAVGTTERGDVACAQLDGYYHLPLLAPQQHHVPLRFVSDSQSRAPPIL